ncbi:protein disulfide isomerase-like 1-6 [Silene latifolia]|uniref:protein disulfide isomerase-like 1-6 n=1 Tax=Silene latifolia TaxID=37657 RepID=UPI003D784125
MLTKNPILNLTIITLILISITTFSLSNELDDEADDFDELEQLLSIDEQQDQEQQQQSLSSPSSSSSGDAKVLSKAQRIVVELNNDNTQKTIDKNEQVLILGYTPWCPRSAELMPQFAQAANFLNDLGSSLLMAKLDAERFPKTASSLGIKGYPTLLLFNNGTSQPYTGGFTSEEIVIWAQKKTGKPVVRVSSVAEAEALVKKYSILVFGLFEAFEGPDYEEFVNAAVEDNEIQFVETNSYEAANHIFPDVKLSKPFIGLIKSEPEKYTSFEEPLKTEKILQFLNYNKFPLVTTLTELNSVKVYSSQTKLQVYVFAETDEFKPLLQPLQEVAKKFKTKIMLIYVDITEDNLAKPFLTMLGLEDSSKTVVAAFDSKISSKYLLESEPTPSNIEEFCSGLLDGTVPLYYKSQAIPDNTNASVVVAVGKTLNDLVFSSSKNVLLEVYIPWCPACDVTTKQVEKLAKHFKGLENLTFARIDASANEHPKLQVTDYPTLLFYPAADKSTSVKLSTKSGLKEMAAFIKKNVKAEVEVAKDEL